ncbi:protein SHQ1 homolog [Atheta coriaria]|uniref:protein SHQ1 homolog n=1 Tax=Dalotia coriaria TaxID=877792 RepID=UPI0031F40A15
MITPRFHLSQNEKTFTITIRAPYCSLKELDVQIDDETFLFYCKPYYLRLKLPGKIEEERNAHSQFNSDTGEFTFTYYKTNKGETFENLEFITQFLQPKLEVHDDQDGRKIEVLSSSAPAEEVLESEEQYGFAQRGGYKFNFISSEFYDIFELDPHEIPLKDRKELRLKSEKESFNFDHYLADFIDCDEIDSLVHEKSPWKTKLEKVNETEADKTETKTFTNVELDFLKDLPNIIYEISSIQEQYAFTTLLDILFAYCYDRRINCFDSSCESGWNILKLSASMQWFDAFDTPKDAIIAGFRRALIYPLYRNFNLCTAVLEDVKTLIKLGETEIIKVLIEIYGIFLGGDSARYILNHLFIKDYVIFVQKWDKTKWRTIFDEIQSLLVKKSDLDLNLDEIEELSNENEEEDELNQQLKGLSINSKKTNEELDSDDDESVDSDSDSTDSDDTNSESESDTESESDSE